MACPGPFSHPGAQLRFADINGHRFTAFATDARRGQLADLELRHRRRARCEDRIRCAKDTRLRNLPLHGFDQNQVWCELVAMASELLAWTAMLALEGPARAWEPKRLRLRLFSAAGRLARGGRRLRLRIAATWPRPASSPPRSPACKPSPPADQPNRHCDQERTHPGPVEPRPPGTARH
jgi:Transposase DDE domain group 1